MWAPGHGGFRASETVAQEPIGADGGQLCALACQSEATATGKRQAKRAIGSCRYCGLDKPQPLQPQRPLPLCLLQRRLYQTQPVPRL
jgi:hypothetical protein